MRASVGRRTRLAGVDRTSDSRARRARRRRARVRSMVDVTRQPDTRPERLSFCGCCCSCCSTKAEYFHFYVFFSLNVTILRSLRSDRDLHYWLTPPTPDLLLGPRCLFKVNMQCRGTAIFRALPGRSHVNPYSSLDVSIMQHTNSTATYRNKLRTKN